MSAPGTPFLTLPKPSGTVNLWWYDGSAGSTGWTQFDRNQQLMMRDLFLSTFSFVLISVILVSHCVAEVA